MDELASLLKLALTVAPFGQQLERTASALTLEPAGVTIVPWMLTADRISRPGFFVTQGRLGLNANTVYGRDSPRAAVRQAMQCVLAQAPAFWAGSYSNGDIGALVGVARRAIEWTGMEQAIVPITNGIQFAPAGTAVTYGRFQDGDGGVTRGVFALRERPKPGEPNFVNHEGVLECSLFMFREDSLRVALRHVLDAVLDQVLGTRPSAESA